MRTAHQDIYIYVYVYICIYIYNFVHVEMHHGIKSRCSQLSTCKKKKILLEKIYINCTCFKNLSVCLECERVGNELKNKLISFLLFKYIFAYDTFITH